ncbi:hypothetical protein EU528_06095 [Candidatus Thorarchaeota archaeon]|nr:MAG: hypothetical protein EU528_06095 [Candidatus Thorarchaeota archaeon]
MFSHFRYPTKKQSSIWLKRRDNIPPSVIAKELKVSRPFVSQAQKIAQGRIKKLILAAAQMNRITIDNISTEFGFARGINPATDAKTYITFSPEFRVQVWYEHEGDCSKCELHSECDRILRGLAGEWGFSIPQEMNPTEVAKILFDRIMRRLGWE